MAGSVKLSIGIVLYSGKTPSGKLWRRRLGDLAKVGVEGSNPFARSNFLQLERGPRPGAAAAALAGASLGSSKAAVSMASSALRART